MAQLNALYKNQILKLNANPQNYGVLKDASHIMKEDNIHCGDSVIIYFLIKEEKIQQICFQAEGCAILKASASIMTEMVKQKDLTFAQEVLESYFDAVRTGNGSGEFEIFNNFKAYPSRAACASLPWNGLAKLLFSRR